MDQHDNLKKLMAKLRLKKMAGHFDEVFEIARQKNFDITQAMTLLAEMEIERRYRDAILAKWRQSKLYDKRTIDEFDFTHHKSRKDQKNRILSLVGLEFVHERADVIIVGNPGTGKSFLAKVIGNAAVNANIKTLFCTAMDMINHLIAADADRSLLKKLHYYQLPDLLILDELGYLSLGQQGSDLFFQVISSRHEKKSTIVTTNLVFSEWGQVFESEAVALAIADRLVNRSEILIMEGKSYRQRKNK